MKRRDFLRGSLKIAAATATSAAFSQEDDTGWSDTWNSALATLSHNVKLVPRYDRPVLWEGTAYRGTWMECGPHEGLAYAQLSAYVPSADDEPTPLEVARNTHRAFFSLQREDGQLPASVKLSGMNWGQIQMVVPIAATGWEVAQIAQDESFLTETYASCSK